MQSPAKHVGGLKGERILYLDQTLGLGAPYSDGLASGVLSVLRDFPRCSGALCVMRGAESAQVKILAL